VFAFKINSQDRNSIVSLGPNQQIDNYQSNKRNQGVGEMNGDLQTAFFPLNAINDNDLSDSGSVKNSVV
jgi:hypothetical protein